VRIIVLFAGITTLLAMMAGLVATKPQPEGAAPAKPETVATFPYFTMKIPDGWATRTELGTTHAYKEPCPSKNCSGVAVYGYEAMGSGSIQAKITNYSCASNASEKPGKLVPKGIRPIGNHDANYYTVSLCGASNSNMLAVYQIPAPPLLILAFDNPLYAMPDLGKRLKEATWTATT
jgi:hypothetical protein